MDNLKILHLNDVANVGSNYVLGLQKLGVQADLFPIVKGVRNLRISQLLFFPFVKGRELFILRHHVIDEQINIVHVHYLTHAYLPLFAGLKYYLHLHGSDIRRDLHNPILKYFDLFAMMKAIKVIYVTPDLEHTVRRYRPDAIFLPNPIDVDRFAPVQSDDRAIPRVLCISKLDQYKGVERFLQTIELLWKHHSEVEISMFSHGNNNVANSFLETHKDNPRLVLLPKVHHNTMPEIIRSYDIVLGQQSLDVGSLGLSELEAMACGKPVVCYFNFPKAYSEPPPVLVSKTPEEACTHILGLIENGEYRQHLSSLSRAWVEKFHSQKYIAQRLLDIYKTGKDISV